MLDDAHDDYSKALEIYTRLLQANTQPPFTQEQNSLVAKCLSGMGLVHERKGDYVKAFELYGQEYRILAAEDFAPGHDSEHTLQQGLPEELAQLERWQNSVDAVLSWQTRAIRTYKTWATPANASNERDAMDLNLHLHVGTADLAEWGKTPERTGGGGDEKRGEEESGGGRYKAAGTSGLVLDEWQADAAQSSPVSSSWTPRRPRKAWHAPEVEGVRPPQDWSLLSPASASPSARRPP
eukprot:2136405-Rhodomonas_salina.1